MDILILVCFTVCFVVGCLYLTAKVDGRNLKKELDHKKFKELHKDSWKK
jgi:hypothetical protein